MNGDDSSSAIGLFDLEREVLIVERRLPHWAQAGTIAFITWRIVEALHGRPDQLPPRPERTLLAAGWF
jgi:hypothetical protein